MIQNGNHIIADEGKIFRRKESGEDYGPEIYLGYSYYIGGILQNPPHLDIPEDFEEINSPEGMTQDEIDKLDELSDAAALHLIINGYE